MIFRVEIWSQFGWKFNESMNNLTLEKATEIAGLLTYRGRTVQIVELPSRKVYWGSD